MILTSVVSSALIGAFFGALYSLLHFFSYTVQRLLKRLFKKGVAEKTKSSFTGNIFDCFFVLAVGICYFISCYIFLDSTFEIYSLASLILAFSLSKRALCLILRVNRST